MGPVKSTHSPDSSPMRQPTDDFTALSDTLLPNQSASTSPQPYVTHSGRPSKLDASSSEEGWLPYYSDLEILSPDPATGLSSEEVARRRLLFGPNKFADRRA